MAARLSRTRQREAGGGGAWAAATAQPYGVNTPGAMAKLYLIVIPACVSRRALLIFPCFLFTARLA